MNIRYHVELSEAERCELTALVGSGKHYARKIKQAQFCSRPRAIVFAKACELRPRGHWLKTKKPDFVRT